MKKEWTRDTEQCGKPKILLVDNDKYYLARAAESLREQGFEVEPVQYGDKAHGHQSVEDIVRFALTPANRIDAVLTDLYKNDDCYGPQLAERLDAMGFNGPVFVHSTVLPLTPKELDSTGGPLFRKPPFTKSDLKKTAGEIHQCLERRGRVNS